jgi:hypothetical protein
MTTSTTSSSSNNTTRHFSSLIPNLITIQSTSNNNLLTSSKKSLIASTASSSSFSLYKLDDTNKNLKDDFQQSTSSLNVSRPLIKLDSSLLTTTIEKVAAPKLSKSNINNESVKNGGQLKAPSVKSKTKNDRKKGAYHKISRQVKVNDDEIMHDNKPSSVLSLPTPIINQLTQTAILLSPPFEYDSKSLSIQTQPNQSLSRKSSCNSVR